MRGLKVSLQENALFALRMYDPTRQNQNTSYEVLEIVALYPLFQETIKVLNKQGAGNSPFRKGGNTAY